ncbi:MAG: phenylpropionate dioxygenase-like ring-hydroxylating dioxygenase large terminal subunit [Parasphingorhabdus sp.]|jgi:phenylpropionate dioxygenase-like ring-hydroxylating dioxygenase large terminal subunit
MNQLAPLPTETRDALAYVSSESASSATLPPVCYSDSGIFDYEVENLFRRGWVSIGRADSCPAAGDFKVFQIGTISVLLIRNQSGQLKSFANTCRHRGSTLLEGHGSCKRIRCPFHSWTYDLDGELTFAPRMKHAGELDAKYYGLVEFSLTEQEGFVFINPEKNCDASDWFKDFSIIHAPWQLSEWETTRNREFVVNCNWKAFIEVFNEYYHLPYVHPSSIGGFYPEPDAPNSVDGCFTTQFGDITANASLLSEHQSQALPAAKCLTGRNAQGIRYTWVYPNVTFAAAADCLWIYSAYPISATKTHIMQTVCFPPGSLEREDFAELSEHYYERIDLAVQEDLPFLYSQQTGLSSPYARPGRFSELEPSVANFAHWYANNMQAD